MVCNTNDRCSLYPSPDSTWIELCPANWREAFKADTLRKGGGVGLGGGWGGWFSTSMRYKWKISCNSTEWQDSHWDVLRMSQSTDVFHNNILSLYQNVCVVLFVFVCVRVCSYFFHALLRLRSGSIHLRVSLLLLHHFCCWVKGNPMDQNQEQSHENITGKKYAGGASEASSWFIDS